MYGKRSYTFNRAGQSGGRQKVAEPHHIEVVYLTKGFMGDSHAYTPRLQYSKSSRAKCHGKLCGGSPIAQGVLRYGHAAMNDTYGEFIQWKHW